MVWYLNNVRVGWSYDTLFHILSLAYHQWVLSVTFINDETDLTLCSTNVAFNHLLKQQLHLNIVQVNHVYMTILKSKQRWKHGVTFKETW